MSYVGKVKGRGYFTGICRKTEYTPKTEAEKTAERKLSNRNWVYPFNQKDYMVPIFKRNISDVPTNWIRESKSDYNAEFLKCMDLGYLPKFKNDSFIDKIEILQFDTATREKRVRNGQRWTGSMNYALALKPYGAVQFCNECGTNIYNDEVRLNVNASVICIHCLQDFAKTIKTEYKKTPKRYKDDYLVSRTLDAL